MCYSATAIQVYAYTITYRVNFKRGRSRTMNEDSWASGSGVLKGETLISNSSICCKSRAVPAGLLLYTAVIHFSPGPSIKKKKGSSLDARK